MASIGLKVIRGMFGAVEHLTPGLGGRAAFELFCRTPDRRKLTAGERRAVDNAASFLNEARHHRLRTRSGCIMVHEFRPVPRRPAAGTVLVIHGWRSRTEYMRKLIEGYCKGGFRVLSLDLPGHGASQGRRLTMANAVDAVRTVDEWFGPFIAVVGHSFGGAVALSATAGAIRGIAPLAVRRLILIAAPNAMSDVFAGFGQHINIGPRTASALDRQVERVSGHRLSYFVGAEFLQRLKVPTLVIHAPDDREVPADNASALGAAGSHVQLQWAPGLGHRRILADPTVVQAAVGFVGDARELTH
ncbi:MAG: alpha/beta hydrolase [Pseudaminobacter sp.]